MTGTPVSLFIVGVWVLVGLLTVVRMARQGHRDPAWLFPAVALRPVMAVAASERIQRRPRRLARMETGTESPWHLGVLVGVDGSAESGTTLDLAVDLLGPRTRELVVAEVMDYDAAEADMRGRPVSGVPCCYSSP
jgi:hypothetical protein